jgi:hypothetical protein
MDTLTCISVLATLVGTINGRCILVTLGYLKKGTVAGKVKSLSGQART